MYQIYLTFNITLQIISTIYFLYLYEEQPVDRFVLVLVLGGCRRAEDRRWARVYTVS